MCGVSISVGLLNSERAHIYTSTYDLLPFLVVVFLLLALACCFLALWEKPFAGWLPLLIFFNPWTIFCVCFGAFVCFFVLCFWKKILLLVCVLEKGHKKMKKEGLRRLEYSCCWLSSVVMAGWMPVCVCMCICKCNEMNERVK